MTAGPRVIDLVSPFDLKGTPFLVKRTLGELPV